MREEVAMKIGLPESRVQVRIFANILRGRLRQVRFRLIFLKNV